MEKKLWLSKTLWTNVILSICAIFLPPVQVWISSHVTETALIWSGIATILRIITKEKIVLY